ncbi:MAG: hypothetical protein IKK92_02975 [Prevotella sp.]|nr:hypothetical protein [Prevotella sp.]
MKKLYFLFITALFCAAAQAQTTLVATLSHGSEISQFYGEEALVEAHEAAVEGDVITLSGGTFADAIITKAITLRGAGMLSATDYGTQTTYIAAMQFQIPENASVTPTIEGLRLGWCGITGENKAKINILKTWGGFTLNKSPQANFINCVVTKLNTGAGLDAGNPFVYCQNSYLNSGATFLSQSELLTCVNSIVTGYVLQSKYVVANNCIIIKNGINEDIPTGPIVNNSLLINVADTDDLLQNISGTGNYFKANTTLSEVFKTYKGSPSSVPIEETDLLMFTDEAAALYLGDDGKQVGIYGGLMPFNATPSNPRITKFVVTSTTSEGKLNVQINVQ